MVLGKSFDSKNGWTVETLTTEGIYFLKPLSKSMRTAIILLAVLSLAIMIIYFDSVLFSVPSFHLKNGLGVTRFPLLISLHGIGAFLGPIPSNPFALIGIALSSVFLAVFAALFVISCSLFGSLSGSTVSYVLPADFRVFEWHEPFSHRRVIR